MSQASQARHDRERTLDCPSAPSDAAGARIFGVVMGGSDAPEVTYLEEPVPVSDELLALADGVRPTEVFRVVGRCQESACVHYSGTSCKLGARIAQTLPSVTASLHPCSIRTSCRWFAEQGVTACFRCPQVVTDLPASPEGRVARASTSRRQLPVV